MARYIDADKLERDLRLERSAFEWKHGTQNDPLSFGGALKHMEDRLRMMTGEADVMPVVRCKDCGYYRHGEKFKFCDRPGEDPVRRFPEDFCSRGVKKCGDTL